MESTVDNFLSFDEISNIKEKKEKLNPIDTFIYHNEPTGNAESKQFRTQLFEAINFASNN